jgi:hypothetical protein
MVHWWVLVHCGRELGAYSSNIKLPCCYSKVEYLGGCTIANLCFVCICKCCKTDGYSKSSIWDKKEINISHIWLVVFR